MASAEGSAQGRGFRALLVTLVLALFALASTGSTRRVFDSLVLAVFPSRPTIQVTPGNARVAAGSPLVISARLVGGGPPLAQVEIGEGDRWRTVDMTPASDSRFRHRLEAVNASFKYRVLAGAVTSPTYTIGVGYPPRVTRIDLEYTYPDELGLKPRAEQDGGNVSAPRGATVRVHVYADRPVAIGQLKLGDGERIPLALDKPTELSVVLRVEGDNSYRVVLAGPDGFASTSDVDYLIRAATSATSSTAASSGAVGTRTRQ
jgi:hypothetical protein